MRTVRLSPFRLACLLFSTECTSLANGCESGLECRLCYNNAYHAENAGCERLCETDQYHAHHLSRHKSVNIGLREDRETLRSPNIHRSEVLRVPRLANEPLDLLLDADLLDTDRLRVGRDLQPEQLVVDRLERFECPRASLFGTCAGFALLRGGTSQLRPSEGGLYGSATHLLADIHPFDERVVQECLEDGAETVPVGAKDAKRDLASAAVDA